MIRSDITIDSAWFTGEIKTLEFEILQRDKQTPLNCTGLNFSFMLKINEGDLDAAALLTKSGSSVTVSGTYNADRSVNTQRVNVSIAANDTRVIPGWTIDNNLVYWHELKRTDVETVVSQGTVHLQQSLHLGA